MRSFLSSVAASVALLGFAPLALAGGGCDQPAMLVFDGSGSMLEMGFNLLDEPRIFEARRAVAIAMPPIAAAREVGLVTYGGVAGASCENIRLRFAPQPRAAGRIIAAIEALLPEGETALTEAVSRAAEEIPTGGDVVLVTDGKETCFGEPCELAATLAAERPQVTVHVIGFKVRGDHFSWDGEGKSEYLSGTTVARCLADRTGGFYLSTENAEELAAALRQTLGCQIVSWVHSSTPTAFRLQL